MRTYYQITSELYQEHIIPVLNAKQYDSGRGVQITLTDCGAVVVPGATEQLRLYCKKEDGTVSYLPGALSGSAIVVDFTNTLLAAAGMVECELQVGAGTDMVSTPVFRIRVLASNRDDSAVESSDEFTALEAAVATVQQYDTRIRQAEDDIDALEATTATLGTAATYGVANDLTTAAAGSAVLDAAQGKALGDRLTTAEGDVSALAGRMTDAEEAIDAIGTVSEGIMSEATETTSATYKAVASVAHGAGMYLVTTSAAFANNSSGIRIAIVTASASSNTVISELATATSPALNGYWTRLSHTFAIRAASAGTWYLKVYQNSGGALNCTTGAIQAIKLSD